MGLDVYPLRILRFLRYYASGVECICNIIAVDAKCLVSDDWKVIGATGAVGAFLGAKL